MTSLSNKDLPFYYNEQLQNFFYYPYIWDPMRGNGLGEDISGVLWLRTFISGTSGFLHTYFGLDWTGITIFYYALYFVLSFLSVSYFVRVFFKWSWIGYIISLLLFSTNTYILMVMHGGQVGVMLAYSIVPLVLGKFVSLIRLSTIDIKSIAVTSLALSFQVLLDVRIAFISCAIIALYLIFHILRYSTNRRLAALKILSVNVFACIFVSLLLHTFWILPSAISYNDVLQSGNENISVDFLSFGLYENSLSLLHPNWPENIFRKTYFLNPLYLFLPIMAFLSLLIFSSKKNFQGSSPVLFFSVIALIGAFLAKGTKEPFGFIYIWLYNSFPGFTLFRDPTKWYVFVSISYTYLISYSLVHIGRMIKKMKLRYCFFGIIFLFWLILIYPVTNHLHTGVFPRKVSDEYVSLKEELVNDQHFSRVLWIPTVSRFAFASSFHPSISFDEFAKTSSASGILSALKTRDFNGLLRNYSIGYVILPDNAEHDIYIKERGYSRKSIEQIKKQLRSSLGVEEKRYKSLTVFKLNRENGLFTCIGSCVVGEFSMVSPSEYRVTLQNVKQGDNLLFSQNFNKHWVLISDDTIQSESYNTFNRFTLSQTGSYTARLYFTKQKLTEIGLIISGITCMVVVIVLLRSKQVLGK